jgi:hypothetical protein
MLRFGFQWGGRSWPRPAFQPSRLVLLTLLLLLLSCRAAAPGSVDAELASCVPGSAEIIAGVHLDEIRANPMLQVLASNWLPLLDPARDASSILIAFNGKDLLWAGRGAFRAAPPGATLLTPQLAVAGPASLVHAAAAQHASGRTGAVTLVAQAEPIAKAPVWAVVQRGAALPLVGNAANFKHVLDLADYTTLAIELNTSIALHLAGICHSADQARQMEETLRGLVSLASAAAARDRDLAALLKTVEIRREGLTVHADVSAGPQTLDHLLGLIPH